VVSDYTTTIRESHTAPEIHRYYQQKYMWEPQTIRDIMWHSHGKALKLLPPRQSTTITKYLHEWLPVNNSKSIQATDQAKLCPICSSIDEDQIHFLTCPHEFYTKLWIQSATNIKKKLFKYDKNIDHRLIQLLGIAITQWRNTTSPPIPDFLPPHYHALHQKQSSIGWNHILGGRFTKEWQKTTSTQWVTYTIRIIWDELYTIWKARSTKNHGDSLDEKSARALQLITPKVLDLYQQRQDLDTDDQYIFKIEVEELLQQPMQNIKMWVHKATLRIRNSKARRKAKHKAKKYKITNQLHPFFQNTNKTTITITNKQPSSRPKNNKKIQTTTLLTFFPRKRPVSSPPLTNNDLFPP
jgi:hypothetical protein